MLIYLTAYQCSSLSLYVSLSTMVTNQAKNLLFLLDQALQSGKPNLASPLHSPLLKSGFLPFVNLKLFLCYFFSGSESALSVYHLLAGNGLEWNSVISSLVRWGFSSRARQVFSLMHVLGLPLCSFSLCSALSAAAASGKAENLGKQIHAYSFKSGWGSSVFLGGAIINFYVKLGLVSHARKMFDEIPHKNSTCANSLLAGYVSSKLWEESLCLVREIVPDEFTLSAALRMCADMPAVGFGRQIHAFLLRREEFLGPDSFLLSLLVEMYGNCGLVEDAERAFFHGGGGIIKDVVIWTSMLNAYSRNGRFGDVVRTFDRMLDTGVAPDGVSFVSVLSACSRTSDLASGLAYFRSMKEDYRISPWPEHYGCIVQLLTASGEWEKAWELAEAAISPEHEEGERVWGSLLAASSETGDLESGKIAAARALRSNPSNVGIFVELSNLFARRGMWREIEILRREMKSRRLGKIVGVSWAENNGIYRKERPI